MPRIENADVVLAEWANGMLGQPYIWGATDCASLVRQAVTIAHQDDLFLGIVGSWDRKFGALRAYATHGGASGALVRTGAAEISPRFAQSGDIIEVVPARGGIAGYWVGVMVGGRVLTSVEEHGVITCPVPEGDNVRAWRLGG